MAVTAHLGWGVPLSQRQGMISASMPARPSTLADLCKTGIITSREIVAAIDAYMRDPGVRPYRFASGYSPDIAAIVAALPGPERVERAGPQEKMFRNGLAAAMMAAHPTPP